MINFNYLLELTVLFISVFILIGTIILTLQTRFIQFRAIPQMCKLLFKDMFKKEKVLKNEESVPAYKALFTAMSTSIGIGNIVSPIIAIKLGGPGALFGFILATIFGSASTFAEVTFALKYRKHNQDGTISGGPMQYIKEVLPPYFSSIYAWAGFLTLVVWSANQVNALSDLLQPRGISPYLTGIVLAITTTYFLVGGIKRIADISTALVPLMFLLYCSATLWIIFLNAHKLPAITNLIFRTAFTPQSIMGAAAGYGVLSAFRWGLAKGFFANESGIGTTTIPHSMAATKNSVNQGVLSMVSVYSNGILCLLSGLVVLLTDTWLDSGLGIGINVIAKSFRLYFSSAGVLILLLGALLFSFGTMLGNSYNGGQCFLYMTRNRFLNYYNILIAITIFLGAIVEVEFLAKITDFFLIPIAIPNMIAIIILAYKQKDVLKVD